MLMMKARYKLSDSDSSIFKDDVVFKYANDEDTIKRLCGIEINADSLLPVPDIRSGMESYRKFIGISKISAYGILCRYRHNIPSHMI